MEATDGSFRQSGPESDHCPLAGNVWGPAFLNRLNRPYSDSMAVPQPVPGSLSPPEYVEIYTALLRTDHVRPGFMRGIVVCMRTVRNERVGHTLCKCCRKLCDTESVLLCIIWEISCVQGKPFAIKGDASVQGRENTDIVERKGNEKYDQRNCTGLQGGTISEALRGQHPCPNLS